MAERNFSIDELEQCAVGLIPDGLRDRVSVRLYATRQIKPLTATPEGRAAIAARLQRLRAAEIAALSKAGAP